jgi:CBS domain-containing protein
MHEASGVGARVLSTASLRSAEPFFEESVMRMHEVMSVPVHTIGPEASLAEAAALMHQRRIHHLVVLDGRRVVGVLSARDLLGRKDGPVSSVMAPHPATATPTTTVRQAANLLRGRSLGCLPVLEDGRPVGMVTVSDLLELVGRGAVRPVGESTPWTLADRGPRQRARSPEGRFSEKLTRPQSRRGLRPGV